MKYYILLSNIICLWEFFSHLSFDNEQIDKLRKGVFSDLEAINQKYVTADEIMNGLINEGYVSLKGEIK